MYIKFICDIFGNIDIRNTYSAEASDCIVSKLRRGQATGLYSSFNLICDNIADVSEIPVTSFSGPSLRYEDL